MARASVSVCVPSYNGEAWIASAIESTLAQTYEDWELIVSDDLSTDRTVEVVRSFDDPRIRVDISPTKLGAVANWNRSIALSSGRFVKFLHQDDVLRANCIAEMVELAEEDPRIGLVFARREIAFDGTPTQDDIDWANWNRNPHSNFTTIDRDTDGLALFRQLFGARVEENWVGEPSSVLMTRECLEAVGLFSPHLHQLPDLDLWVRAMLGFRVGFIDAELSSYLRHTSSLTVANARHGHAWLDHLWLLEGLLREELQPDDRKQVKRLRNSARRGAIRNQVRRAIRWRWSTDLVRYYAYLGRVALGRPTPLYPRLEDAAVRAPAHTPAAC